MSRPVILVVDADVGSRCDLSFELQRMDFAVETAGGGEEAIQRVAETGPHVVLLDLRLPGESSLETLLSLSASAPQSDVIVLASPGTIDTAIRAVRAGAFDYICTPCRLDELEVRIRRALEWRRLRARVRQFECGTLQSGDISTLRDVERLQIQRALRATGGRRARAARLLGISERNLYRKIHTYQLEGLA